MPEALKPPPTAGNGAEPVIKDDQPRAYFDCNKCPAFCCSVYERVRVTKRDVTRLAKHFGVTFEVAWRRYTKDYEGERVLKRAKDYIFEETCTFLDQRTRRCTIGPLPLRLLRSPAIRAEAAGQRHRRARHPADLPRGRADRGRRRGRP
jgi:Putative zinc- or iron-chelating domain